MASESGGMILGWLLRIACSIAIVAVAAFDGLSIGVAHISAIDDANSVARSASSAWTAHHDMQAALAAAQETAAQHGETVLPNSLQVASDGTCTVRIARQATTLIIGHIKELRSWVRVTESGSGRYVE